MRENHIEINNIYQLKHIENKNLVFYLNLFWPNFSFFSKNIHLLNKNIFQLYIFGKKIKFGQN
jgi:hypothetical protein